MEDEKIVALYWERDPQAITESEEKYERYCYKIAYNILMHAQDCEECINDTWLRAWNSMPSERPALLGAFLGSITRNLSIDRYRRNHAKRRGEGSMDYIFDELQDCILTDGPEEHLDVALLVEALNSYLERLTREHRMIFVRRYWYLDSIEEIAKRYSLSESKVKSSLFRTRKKLKEYLIQEEFEL